MHTFNHMMKDGRGITLLHYGDFSGDVRLIVASEEVVVPVEALRAFVAEIVRRERIERIEEMSDDEVLR